MNEGKVVPVLNHAPFHEDVWTNEGIASRVLNIDTRWRLVVRFVPRPFKSQHKEQRPRTTLEWRLSGLQSRSRHGGKEKNDGPLPGIGPLSSSL